MGRNVARAVAAAWFLLLLHLLIPTRAFVREDYDRETASAVMASSKNLVIRRVFIFHADHRDSTWSRRTTMDRVQCAVSDALRLYSDAKIRVFLPKGHVNERAVASLRRQYEKLSENKLTTRISVYRYAGIFAGTPLDRWYGGIASSIFRDKKRRSRHNDMLEFASLLAATYRAEPHTLILSTSSAFLKSTATAKGRTNIDPSYGLTYAADGTAMYTSINRHWFVRRVMETLRIHRRSYYSTPIDVLHFVWTRFQRLNAHLYRDLRARQLLFEPKDRSVISCALDANAAEMPSASGTITIDDATFRLQLPHGEDASTFAYRVLEEMYGSAFAKDPNVASAYTANVRSLEIWARKQRRTQSFKKDELRRLLRHDDASHVKTRLILAADVYSFGASDSTMCVVPGGIDRIRTHIEGIDEVWTYAHSSLFDDDAFDAPQIFAISTFGNMWTSSSMTIAESVQSLQTARRLFDALDEAGVLCITIAKRDDVDILNLLRNVGFRPLANDDVEAMRCALRFEKWTEENVFGPQVLEVRPSTAEGYTVVAMRKSRLATRLLSYSSSLVDASTLFDARRVVVLNLDRRPDRWRTVRAALTSAGIDPRTVDRFAAVDGRHLLTRDDRSGVVSTAPRLRKLFELSAFGSDGSAVPGSWRSAYGSVSRVGGVGAYGCAASHLRIWKEMCADSTLRDEDYWVVFEDDVRFPVSEDETSNSLALSSWKSALRAVQHRDADWDLIYMGFADYRNIYGDESIYYQTTPSSSLSASQRRRVVKLTSWPRSTGGGTFAYTIRKRAAKIFVRSANRRGILDPLDWWMKQHFDRTISAYLCDPPLAKGDNAVLNRTADSDISSSHNEGDDREVSISVSDRDERRLFQVLDHIREPTPAVGSHMTKLQRAEQLMSSTSPKLPLEIVVREPSSRSYVLPNFEIRAEIVHDTNRPLPSNWAADARVCFALESPAIGSRARFIGCLPLDTANARVSMLPYGPAVICAWISPGLSPVTRSLVHVVPFLPRNSLPQSSGIDGLPYASFELRAGISTEMNDSNATSETPSTQALAICMLVYRGGDAFLRALRSWDRGGLLALTPHRILLLQDVSFCSGRSVRPITGGFEAVYEMSIEDLLASRDPRLVRTRSDLIALDIRVLCSPRQLGIAGGLLVLGEFANNVVEDAALLFLEEDWQLVNDDDAGATREAVSTALAMVLRPRSAISSHPPVDVVRLRHRYVPGDPLCAKHWSILESPSDLLRALAHENGNHSVLSSMYWIDDPSAVFGSSVIWRYNLSTTTTRSRAGKERRGDTFFCTRSSHSGWTNNPHLVRAEWWLANIAPIAAIDLAHMDAAPVNRPDWDKGRLEPAINNAPPLWDRRGYVICQGTGLFRHADTDRPLEEQSKCPPVKFVLEDSRA